MNTRSDAHGVGAAQASGAGSSAGARSLAMIRGVRLKVGMEVHVELSTRTKVFSRSPSIAARGFDEAAHGPNSCVDEVVLGLPGALPVLNAEAVRLSVLVGLALGCRIATRTRWDRKSYFYPDMPKNYQVSQYDLPLCFDGSVDLVWGGGGEVGGAAGAGAEAARTSRIGIVRAHLEEDAGKLLHEAPGGHAIDYSIVDYNRAGTALLEIVTQPDFGDADEVVAFCQWLRGVVRFVGASEGVMQKGHVRFEPNINVVLTLDDGRTVATPVVEVKNLNSFKSVRGAIEHELREQPGRWVREGREFGPGTKQTRGWDDARGATYVMREKEDAHDYRYFPEPDLLPLTIDAAWVEGVRASLPELPSARAARYERDFGLGRKEALALVDEREVCELFEASVAEATARGVVASRAGKQAANVLLQWGQRRANERTSERQRGQANEREGAAGAGVAPVLLSELGITARSVGALAHLREDGRLSNTNGDELFGLLCEESTRERDAEELAQERGLLIIRDEGAIESWVRGAIAEQAKAADDVRAGKDAAIGRLVGAAMKLSGGKGDAAELRQRIIKALRG